jgi:hypothetical protein
VDARLFAEPVKGTCNELVCKLEHVLVLRRRVFGHGRDEGVNVIEQHNRRCMRQRRDEAALQPLGDLHAAGGVPVGNGGDGSHSSARAW